jgi:hypothetical protein
MRGGGYRIEHPMIGVVERQKAVGITALLEPEKVAAAFRRAGFRTASGFYAMTGGSNVRYSAGQVRMAPQRLPD